MKIIFLDIDGPMLPGRCMFLPGQTRIMTLFDPVAVSMLNRAADNLGAKIVLHTSWIRVMGPQVTYDHCIEQGIKAEHFHEDPWCREDIHWRYTRVSEWLRRHPEVEAYVMIDDDEYEDEITMDNPFPHPADMADHLVKVNYNDGFMFSHMHEIERKLNERIASDGERLER